MTEAARSSLRDYDAPTLRSFEIELPRGALREYLLAAKITAIYVATIDDRLSTVQITRDLERSVQYLRRDNLTARLAHAFWCADRSLARVVARKSISGFPIAIFPNYVEAPPRFTALEIVDRASAMSLSLTDHVVVMRRARAAVFRVKQAIERAQANGELNWFNQAFRAWRLRAQSVDRTMSYMEARARLRRCLIRLAIAGELDRISEHLTCKIFPELPEPN
jgi:hypothetical protein